MLPLPKLRRGRYQKWNDMNIAEYVVDLCIGRNRHLWVPELIAHIVWKFNVSPEDIKKAIQQQMFSKPDTFKFERVSEIFICPNAERGTKTYKKQTRLFLKQRGFWVSHVWVVAGCPTNKRLEKSTAEADVRKN